MVSSLPSARLATLERSMGLPAALLLTLSAITPASSVFVIIPGAIHAAGTGALLAMLLALVVGVGRHSYTPNSRRRFLIRVENMSS